jgi:predicted 3-demethylubiquinone-9 3-methyltransferase (glyoxalase superfamily)
VQKITTVLTFDGRAEEAVDFYTSIFANSRILSVTRVDAARPGSAGD